MIMIMIMIMTPRRRRALRRSEGASEIVSLRGTSESGRVKGLSRFLLERPWRLIRCSASNLLASRRAGEVATFAAGLGFELNGATDDALVEGLGHVVDRERRY